MIHHVCNEFDYFIDMCHVTQGALIKVSCYLTHQKLETAVVADYKVRQIFLTTIETVQL